MAADLEKKVEGIKESGERQSYRGGVEHSIDI